MDDDASILAAVSGVASLASAGSRGGPKGPTPAKKKKVLMHVERIEQSLRRKNRRHQRGQPHLHESLIYEGGGDGASFDPDETQSQDGRNPFMAGHDGIGYTIGDDNAGMPDPLMEEQLGMDDSFPLDHEFPKDYVLDEEDYEVDIVGEPLFEEPLPAQANVKKK
ncbi:hypothetical protein D1007_52821 [Hordeum vulgare]|nr:hypothetical protein D1007_52821 [Hordeum vulgare]